VFFGWRGANQDETDCHLKSPGAYKGVTYIKLF